MKDLLQESEWFLIEKIGMSKTRYLKKTPDSLDGGGVKSFFYLHKLIEGDEQLVYRRMVELDQTLQRDYPTWRSVQSGIWNTYFYYYQLLWARMSILAHFFYHDDPLWQEKIIPDMLDMIKSSFALDDVEKACRGIDTYYAKMSKYASEPELPVVQATGVEVLQDLPHEGKYQELAKWIEKEKAAGRDHFADADFNRSEMCRQLSKVVHWTINENSLRKAQNKL